MIILGIETSCDETSASLVHGQAGKVKILSHVIASQITTHVKYGGVVPEVAARQHVIKIIPVLDSTLKQAKVKPKNIDVIAVTRGPGLITSLRVGTQTAKSLSFAWNKKIVGVNHMEGHIYANWHDHPNTKFPVLCLVVSGGHTELILMTGHGQYQLIGRTRDDAAGEAFDKVAKILQIGYPGGPMIQKLAAQGNPSKFSFPRPMLDQDNYDFSFSGLKTSVQYFIKKEFAGKKVPVNDICAGFQQAVIDVLSEKTISASKKLKVKNIMLAGGVAANSALRNHLDKRINKELPGTGYLVPPLSLCTDNAGMIAVAGYHRATQKDFTPWPKLAADPNWELI
ncbi:tRNA (adenosine(37)-N6)-threonylcarbamoyltransferase complex transferase subunit TsaD [Patescibacteria group bacterium]|nr:tRNA (adenosine(37)-N6)-threonylcarbamoyltransferase complex transferase subunit TsaD [Patescibacteria group bacterium]MBU0964051.1 tRNA (adenosine(37)-N6)-threonylcarbamoyltransferase complex transferase subunit TsaD [Patescibacteria group bacterium]